MYRVYYTEDPEAPLAEWSVKLVQVDPALSQSDVTGNSGTLTLLTHLRSNATYHIRVSASNVKGDGPISPPYAVIVRPGGETSVIELEISSRDSRIKIHKS